MLISQNAKEEAGVSGIGTIVGGVVGGICGVSALLFVLFVLKR